MNTKIILEAGKADEEYIKDLWRFRGLFYVLAWRDISVRYKQTAVGILWALIRPALSTAVFTIVFGRLGRFPSGDLPYPVLVLTGMLPWQLFSSALTESGRSLLSNASLITKVYFPRLIVPGSALVTSFIDFLISAVMLAAVMAFYGVAPSWRIIFLPVFTFLALLCAAGVGAWISALNVRYRDIGIIVPFVTQLGLYISPVGFSSRIVPAKWSAIYALNPMVGIIDGFRWCVAQAAPPLDWSAFLISLLVSLVVVVGGYRYFRRTERTFADVI